MRRAEALRVVWAVTGSCSSAGVDLIPFLTIMWCRLAMLGFALAMLGYRVSGLNVWQQFKSAPGVPTLAP